MDTESVELKKDLKKELHRLRVHLWKKGLGSKYVQLPIDENVVRAICSLYSFQFRPVPGYEPVSDLMAGYMAFMNDDERRAWKTYGWQIKYAGQHCQASHHVWATAFKDLPRLYLVSLRLLFPFNQVKSSKRVRWGREHSGDMLFVNFNQFDLVKDLRLQHQCDCLQEDARKAHLKAAIAREMNRAASSMSSLYQSGRLPGDVDEKV